MENRKYIRIISTINPLKCHKFKIFLKLNKNIVIDHEFLFKDNWFKRIISIVNIWVVKYRLSALLCLFV